MFKSKTLGMLTVQLPDNGNQYSMTTEVSIPLLEGGFLFSGVFSPINDARSAEISILASNDLIKHTYTKKVKDGEYEIGIGLPFPKKLFEVTLYTHSSNPQCFYGIVKDLRSKKKYKFTYNDINEPVTAGTVVIIVVGIAAIVCSISMIIGMIANWECKKVEVTFGIDFSWSKKDFTMGCKVKCLD